MAKKRQRTNYKRRSSQAKRNSPIAWLFGGILIGLIFPAVIFFKSASTKKAPDVATIKMAEANNVSTKEVTQKKSATQKEKYDFYDLLSPQEGDTTSSDQFQLEVAKYSQFAEADEMKAKLVLMGFEVFITKSNKKSDPGYRVIAGPYSSKKEASKAQQELKDNGITSILLTSKT